MDSDCYVWKKIINKKENMINNKMLCKKIISYAVFWKLSMQNNKNKSRFKAKINPRKKKIIRDEENAHT